MNPRSIFSNRSDKKQQQKKMSLKNFNSQPPEYKPECWHNATITDSFPLLVEGVYLPLKYIVLNNPIHWIFNKNEWNSVKNLWIPLILNKISLILTG
jgi:hypothetical protein